MADFPSVVCVLVIVVNVLNLNCRSIIKKTDELQQLLDDSKYNSPEYYVISGRRSKSDEQM